MTTKSATTSMASALTVRDTQFIVSGFKAMDSKPDIDFNKLAGLVGVGSAAAARNGFRNAMRKLDQEFTISDQGKTSATADDSKANKTPVRGKSKKVVPANADEDDSLEDEAKKAPSTPPGSSLEDVPMTPGSASTGMKKRGINENDKEKSTPAKRVRVKKEPELDAEGNPVTPKRAPRKPREPKLDENGVPVATPTRKRAEPKKKSAIEKVKDTEKVKEAEDAVDAAEIAEDQTVEDQTVEDQTAEDPVAEPRTPEGGNLVDSFV